MATRPRSYIKRLWIGLGDPFRRFWRKGFFHKAAIVLFVFVFLAISSMYAIAQWYIQTEKSKPLQLGVSFIPDYAQSLGLDPQETMDALLGIGVKQFRLTSYWSDMEQKQGTYDFSQLDWEFNKAEAAHAKIVLTLGLRQPRWPECHIPDWAAKQSTAQWEPALKSYIAKVVERYKDSPSLQQYQLENEYFLKGFGTCTDFSRDRLVEEYALVQQADPHHPIIVARSNNAIGMPIGKPQPDLFSISVYKRVWDAGVTHRYLEYPFPAWYYGFVAGSQKIVTKKDMVIGELQAEAWPPNGKQITEVSLQEQNKSMSATRLKDRFDYGKATGMRQIDLWGAEYWYYRLTKLHDPSLWDVAKAEFSQ